jgi:hypothetical protein
MREGRFIVRKIQFWSKIPSFTDVERCFAEELQEEGKYIYDLTFVEYEKEMYRVAVAWNQHIIKQKLKLPDNEIVE